ncbi:MAG: 50S ribosomal protein L2 [Alphaproteobacteria bacterium MarineAlpha9_Bin4]|nr:50S ribosomal protein L2 [Pelagibacterales bacterium]PPR26258.1 MAG: 50S ribosomal protein L2 [Alphaproteobacteria bacterium MarineAlpha9_Bin4]|tara:strand:+ start:1117 stop:1944 length:828 start_codon:yes stop_codon:yes gene_type:complete
MALKNFNPTTPSRRSLVLVDRSDLHKGSPVKKLTKGLSKTGGRNNKGRTTMWWKGGGHKRSYRIVDFKRKYDDKKAEVIRLEYDPNRTCHIALIKYEDGQLSYIIAPQKLKISDTVISGNEVDIKPGNCLPMRNIPPGTLLHNVELKPGKGGQIARSAGSSVQLVGKDRNNAMLKMVSGEQRLVPLNCRATIGVVSNPDHQNSKSGKAGRSRWLGKRPHVRGVVMNPVDHPHGGGEGKTSGGRNPVTPWGVPTKGKRTRNNKRTDKFILKRRNSR